jgi:hypothetical protein
MNAQPIVDNLLNGNLSDAQSQAKKYSFWTLLMGIENLGYCTSLAANMTSYLKGKRTFGEYCRECEKHNFPL